MLTMPLIDDSDAHAELGEGIGGHKTRWTCPDHQDINERGVGVGVGKCCHSHWVLSDCGDEGERSGFQETSMRGFALFRCLSNLVNQACNAGPKARKKSREEEKSRVYVGAAHGREGIRKSSTHTALRCYYSMPNIAQISDGL